jgi:dynein heavy chain 2, cytosolic
MKIFFSILTVCLYKEPNESNVDILNSPSQLPIIKTMQLQRGVDGITPWLDVKHRQPFLLIGPDGCGKSLVLKQCFNELRSTQVAIVHCSAQTSPSNVLQKLAQTCIKLSATSGHVYRPKDSEHLILYLKDINLPKPDKWGTSQLITFLQQVILLRKINKYSLSLLVTGDLIFSFV